MEIIFTLEISDMNPTMTGTFLNELGKTMERGD
jgi:hypothetical protein